MRGLNSLSAVGECAKSLNAHSPIALSLILIGEYAYFPYVHSENSLVKLMKKGRCVFSEGA